MSDVFDCYYILADVLQEPYIYGWLKALDEHDAATFGHSMSVARIAVCLGLIKSMSSAELFDLARGGLLHDLGKIAVPLEVLNKTDALTDADIALIRKHPQVGYGLVAHSSLSRSVKQMILQHHENFDGTGYPNGFSDDKITVESRILRVADSFAVMTNGRIYQRSMSVASAVKLISADSGTMYDPDIVKCLQKLHGQTVSGLDILRN